MDIEKCVNKQETSEWKSCCLIIDKNATIFFSQLSIAMITLIFCIVQLSLSNTCERDSLYSGILTLVIGVYIPTPRLK